MKKILFLLMSVTLLMGCKSQQDATTIAARDAEQEALFNSAVQALTNQDFVLEADRILFRNGNLTFVTPNTNFVSLKGNKATVQLAFSSPYAGPNGIGGITLDGNASNIKMTIDKKGNVNYSMTVQGVAISATVFFTLTKDSNLCSATITPNFSGRIITFRGNIYPESESNVFKGRSL